jgi:hypothetical protein
VPDGPGATFRQALETGLWVEAHEIAWNTSPSGCVAQILVDGAQPEDDCRLVISIPHKAWPSGSFSLLWRGRRIHGLDLDGPSHSDPASGRTVRTPHYQVLNAQDRESVEAVDIEKLGPKSLEDTFHWFIRRIELTCQSRWMEPPVQGGLTSQTADLRRHRSRSRRN